MKLKAEKWMLGSFLLLLPTQLAFHFWPNWAYVFGFRIDFLAPALYLTDLLIVCLFLLNLHILKIYKKPVLFFLGFALINVFFATSVPESFYRWAKVAEFLFLVAYIKNKNILTEGVIIKNLLYSSAAFSLIGIVQFLKGGAFGSVFYWLGERSFNLSTPGIALVTLNGIDYLRAYSTFSHPNSLAGFLGAVLVFALTGGKLKKSGLNILAVLIVSLGTFVSFSVTAYFGLLFCLLFILLSRREAVFTPLAKTFIFVAIIISLLMPILAPGLLDSSFGLTKNIAERLDLAYIAGKLISSHFITGVGLGNFITNVTLFKGIFSFSWLLQPVHNIFLLVASEVGIPGLLLFGLFLYKILVVNLKKKRFYFAFVIIFIVFTGFSDHYWLTLQQNFLLLSLLTGMALR